MSRSRSNPSKRRPGGQPGNTNALKHGFWSAALDRADREVYTAALALSPTDLHREVAILRERLLKLIKADPTQIELFVKGIGQIARLAATHYHLQGTAAASLTDAMHNVLADIERTLDTKGD